MSAEISPLPPGMVEVNETLTGTYTNAIRAGGHSLFADEPAEVGGDDKGPTPHDFVMAGLGACTSITMRMYAARKGFPLKRISVRVWMRKEGAVTEMTRDITLEGDLTEEQRTRLLEIANKCPVHRTLSGEIRIQTHLVN